MKLFRGSLVEVAIAMILEIISEWQCLNTFLLLTYVLIFNICVAYNTSNNR